jgi:hypothetical protein
MENESLATVLSYIGDLDDETTIGYIYNSRKMLYSGIFTDKNMENNEQLKERFEFAKQNQTKWHLGAKTEKESEKKNEDKPKRFKKQVRTFT